MLGSGLSSTGASFIASPWSHDLGKEGGFGDRKILSVCGLLRVQKKHEPNVLKKGKLVSCDFLHPFLATYCPWSCL